MNREQTVNQMAEEILKTAAEEVNNSPFVKTASEEDYEEAVVEKIAGIYESAAAIYKQAEETAVAAAEQEAAAREALVENGIDPDAVIAAAEEAAVAEIEDQKDGK